MPEQNEPVKPKNLIQKLCEIMASLEWVQKRGYNEFHKYAYATEADLADALRTKLAEHNIFIFPNVKSCVRSPLEVTTTKWIQNQPTESVRKTQLTEIEVEWTFVDGDSGELRTILVHGVGEDNVDKGFYKAFTGSEKYMLMKSFLIPTGDDPEQDSKEDLHEAKQSGKTAARNVAAAKLAEANAPKLKEGAALFYVWNDEEQKAYLTGDKELMALNKELLLSLGKWNAKEGAIIYNSDSFESLKYELEQRKVPLKALQKAS